MATSQLNLQIKAVDNASHALKSIQSGIIRLVGAVVALGAAFKAIAFPAKAAADFEREMVNVAKTTNFSQGQIEGLSNTLIELSKSMSLSATELASIAAVAGQLGLGSFGVEAIEEFTESVAKASVTLDLTAEKAAEFGAQITSIFNLDPSNIEQVFSTLNELSNTSVATAGQIADIVKRIGSVGGVTLQQSSALAAFFRDMGVQVEVAGTSTVKVLSNMSAKAKDFAEVAGVSTKQWLELLEQDTIVALTTVTSKLHEMDRAQRDATAKELFGGGRILSTFTKLIDEAGNGYETLNGHIESATSSYKSGTSSLEEYEKVMSSLSEQTKVMFNSIRAVAIEMGEKLTPTILEAVTAFTAWINSDVGKDFFLQISDSIKVLIDTVLSSIDIIVGWGHQWTNVINVVIGSIKVLIGISLLKWAVGVVASLESLVASLAKYATFNQIAALASAKYAKAQASTIAITRQAVIGYDAESAAIAKNSTQKQHGISVAAALAKAETDLAIAEKHLNTVQSSSIVVSKTLVAARADVTRATAALTVAENAHAASVLNATLAQNVAAKSARVQAAKIATGALGASFVPAVKGVNLLTGAVNLLKVAFSGLIRLFTGPFALVITGIYLFRDAIEDLTGLDFSFKNAVELSEAQEFRIDERVTEAKLNKALRTLEDIAQKVSDRADVDIEVPLSTDVVTDRVDFADKVSKELSEATRVVDAANIVQEIVSVRLAEATDALAFDIKVGISADKGDDTALYLQYLEKEIRAVTAQIDKATTEQSNSMNGYISEVAEHMDGLKDRLSDLKSDYQKVAKTFDEGFTLSIKDASLEQLENLRLDAIGNDQQGLTQITLEQIKAIDELIKQKKVLENANKEQAAAEIEVAKNASLAADIVGLAAATRISSITLEMRTLQKSLADIDKVATEAKKKIDKLKGANEGEKEDLKLKIDESAGTERELLRIDILKKEKLIREELAKTKVKDAEAALKGLADQGLAAAKITHESLKNLEANEKNIKSLEDTADAELANLSEMIVKRAVLNVQLKEYDEYAQDALDVAKRMDGAYDNISKTIRTMTKSISDYGASLDEIVRKRLLSEGNAEFNIKIDKTVDDEIDKITKKYDELIKKAEEDVTPGFTQVGGFSVLANGRKTVEQLEKQKELAIDKLREDAKLDKLAEKRKNSEAEVTRALENQRDAQQDLSRLISKIQNIQDAGGFDGAEGLNEYREAMLELEEAQNLVANSSSVTRNALNDLGGVKATDPASITAYKEELKNLDKAGISLKKNQAELNSELASSTQKLAGVQRLRISSEYDLLNTKINAITKASPALVKEVNNLTAEANKSAEGYGKMATSMDGVIEKMETMAITGAKFSNLFEVSDKAEGYIANIGKLLQGGATEANVQVGLVLEEGTAETLKAQVDAVLNPDGGTDPTIETGVVVTGFTNSEGDDQFVMNAIVNPDEDTLKRSTKVVIEGQTYFFKADTPKVRESLEKSFKKAFDITVNVAGTNALNNATGGHISGPGSGTSDSILSWLSNGEYVIRAASVAKFGSGFFDMLNAGMLPRFASGGLASLAGGGSATTANMRDSIDLNFNVGGKKYTLHGERDQAKAIVNMFKNMDRG